MYERKSRLSAWKRDRLIEHFVAGTTGRAAAELVGVHRNTAASFYTRLRKVIAEEMEQASPFAGEIEVDESYFGGARKGKRGRAAADAVARARRLPALRVGLHVVVARDRPVLPAHDIPDLVDAAGNLRSNLVEAGFRYFFRPSIRRQLRSEIAAQFAAFRDTGLPLDHVNAHNHMHFHPTVLTYILDIGRDYGVRAIRLPYEPFLPSWRASRTDFFRRLGTSLFLTPWSALMRRRIGCRGLARNDYVFGMYDSGRFDAERVLDLLECLPPGVTELYFHPATAGTVGPAGYGRTAELAALVEPRVAEKIRVLGIDVIGFGDLTDPRSS